MRLIGALLALGLAAACGGRRDGPAEDPREAREAALRTCGSLSARAYCGVRFGMTAEDAKSAFPQPTVQFASSSSDACQEFYAKGALEGVSFMIEHGRVGRVDVTAPGPKTVDGFGVGSKEADLKARLGARLSSSSNKYDPQAMDLTYTDGDGRIVFEVSGGLVRALRAGLPPMIDYVERCG